MGPIIMTIGDSQYFTDLIAANLSNSEILSVTDRRFRGGERYLKANSDNRDEFLGRDVVLVGSIVSDDDLHQVSRLSSAIAKYGARRIIYVIPFEGYTTMERAVKANEVVTAKVVARQLSQVPQGDLRSCFLFLDLHTAGFVHYFEGECVRFELYGDTVLTEAIRELELQNFIFGTADLSRLKWAKTYAKKFGTRFVIADKDRDFESTHVSGIIGDVSGVNVVIYDDMIRSGGTLMGAADAYLKNGACAVYAVTSHLALDDDEVINSLEYSKIQKVVATNSHPMSQRPRVVRSSKFVVKDVSHLFVDKIKKITGER